MGRRGIGLSSTRVVTAALLFCGCLVSATSPGGSGQFLGPGDQIQVRVSHSPEISERPVRVDESGMIQLPLLGRIHAAGQTPASLADAVRSGLEEYFKNPEVSIEIVESKSHPVSVIGAVKSPGVYQIQGERRLLEVISMAGGIEQDAGHAVRVSRHRAAGPLPLPAAQVHESGDLQVGEIAVADLIEAKRPEENIPIFPQDVISIPRAKLIYVIGDVRKAGGFPLREREKMSVLQALSLAEGLSPTAASRNGKIIRPDNEDGRREEIAVNVRDILSGKLPDQPLRPDEILFIPNSKSKSALMRGIDAAILMGTGVVIWRR